MWSNIFLSGLVKFFNKVFVGGLVGKSIFLVVTTWLVGVLIAGIAGLFGSLLNLTGLSTLLLDGALSVGNIAALGLWLWSLFGGGVVLAIGGLVVRFIIRRIPVVG